MGPFGDTPTREQAGAQLDACLEQLLSLQRSIELDAALGARLVSVQAWQTARLARTYVDQRNLPSRRDAVAFFLNDVYGPRDFALRDRQFQRALRPLKRMLPVDALAGLCQALQMQALSLELDIAMASAIDAPREFTDADYARTYCQVQRFDDRRRQIALVTAIGARLVTLVRLPGVELALRLASAPARLAGFGELQDFLEHGFASFKRLGSSAAEFVATIEQRETEYLQQLVASGPAP